MLKVARNLLGKSLYTYVNGHLTGGVIVETEGYAGAHDKACHAYGKKYTKRTKTMFEPGGVAYIYLCYGIHHLLNVVTNEENCPDAVLIRAIEPHTGVDIMQERRKLGKIEKRITSGPGNVSSALGITREYDGVSMMSDLIWISEDGLSWRPSSGDIERSARVGVDYAEEYAQKPWRFFLVDNSFVSKKR